MAGWNTPLINADKHLIIDTIIPVTADTSYPADVAIDIKKGGGFNVAAGKTLTIKGPVITVPYQVFFGPGAVALEMAREVRAENFPSLSVADAAAVAYGKELVLSSAWYIPVGQTFNAPVRCLPGAVLTLDGALNVNNSFIGCDGCFNVTAFGSIAGLRECCPEWWTIDGVDDHVQFNHAVQSLVWRGTLHTVNNKTYLVDGEILVNKTIRIDGASRIKIKDGATLKAAPDQAEATFSIMTVSANLCVIRDITVDGNMDGNPTWMYDQSANYGIAVTGKYNLVENVTAENVTANGLGVPAYGTGNVFRNCIGRLCGKKGMYLGLVSDNVIDGGQYTDSRFDSGIGLHQGARKTYIGGGVVIARNHTYGLHSGESFEIFGQIGAMVCAGNFIYDNGTFFYLMRKSGSGGGNSTEFFAGDRVRWNMTTTIWECTTPGITAAAPPSITGKVVGDTVVDGGVTWTMRPAELMRENNTAYTVGTRVRWGAHASIWECTTAGVSSDKEPFFVGKVVGDTVTDENLNAPGTGCVWTMRVMGKVSTPNVFIARFWDAAGLDEQTIDTRDILTNNHIYYTPMPAASGGTQGSNPFNIQVWNSKGLICNNNTIEMGGMLFYDSIVADVSHNDFRAAYANQMDYLILIKGSAVTGSHASHLTNIGLKFKDNTFEVSNIASVFDITASTEMQIIENDFRVLAGGTYEIRMRDQASVETAIIKQSKGRVRLVNATFNNGYSAVILPAAATAGLPPYPYAEQLAYDSTLAGMVRWSGAAWVPAHSRKGTTTSDSAAAGDIGQSVSALVAAGSAAALTTNTGLNVTSISLTAGDWDVEGNVNLSAAAATITAMSAGITATSATVPADGSEIYNGQQTVTASMTTSLTMPRKRISIAATTTIYLVARSTFSAGAVSTFGSITARRVR